MGFSLAKSIAAHVLSLLTLVGVTVGMIFGLAKIVSP
jgi:hypothetical protein